MNKKIIWGTIVVIGIIAGGFAYSYLSKPKLVCWPYCPGMTDQDREDIKKSALEAETANWKTYTNDKYGFEFKYPREWSGRIYGVYQVSAPVSSFDSNTDGPTTSIIISEDGRSGIQGEKIIFAGKDSINIGWKMSFQNDFVRTIRINETPLSIQMTATSEGDKTIIDQILSTFKFTSTSTTVTNNSSMSGQVKIITLDVPFTMTTGLPKISYTSTSTPQNNYVIVTLDKFHADACDVLPYKTSSGCFNKGKQAVAIAYELHLPNQNVKKSIAYLIPDPKYFQNKVNVGEVNKDGYEIELVSMDIDKMEATIILRKVFIYPGV